jgi:hypothetical protein
MLTYLRLLSLLLLCWLAHCSTQRATVMIENHSPHTCTVVLEETHPTHGSLSSLPSQIPPGASITVWWESSIPSTIVITAEHRELGRQELSRSVTRIAID